jgi:hypothetical protein
VVRSLLKLLLLSPLQLPLLQQLKLLHLSQLPQLKQLHRLQKLRNLLPSNTRTTKKPAQAGFFYFSHRINR